MSLVYLLGIGGFLLVAVVVLLISMKNR